MDSTKLNKYEKSRYYAYRPIQITTHGGGLAVIEPPRLNTSNRFWAHILQLPSKLSLHTKNSLLHHMENNTLRMLAYRRRNYVPPESRQWFTM